MLHGLWRIIVRDNHNYKSEMNCDPNRHINYDGEAHCKTKLNEFMKTLNVNMSTKSKGKNNNNQKKKLTPDEYYQSKNYRKHGSCIFNDPHEYLCKAVTLFEEYESILDKLKAHGIIPREIGPDPYFPEDIDFAIKQAYPGSFPYLRCTNVVTSSGRTQMLLTEIQLFFDMEFKPYDGLKSFDRESHGFDRESHGANSTPIPKIIYT